MRIDIKPLSINRAWKGRRFKTEEYEVYELELFYQLPKIVIPEGKLSVTLEFGFSMKSSDIDNPIKTFLDILSKKYGFNDKRIYLLVVNKVDTPKKGDYIQFKIEPYTERLSDVVNTSPR